MRLARLSRALVCLAALAPLGGCGSSSPTTPSTGTRAVITITAAPDPITAVLTNTVGPTYTASWTATLTESGAVGGTVQLLRANIFDDATGKLVGSVIYDDKDLVVFVGSNRLEAKGTLAIPLQVSYVLSTLVRAATLTISTAEKDDHGNTVESFVLVKIL
jgi:hypothetical protein